jgi:hypothetical protein
MHRCEAPFDIVVTTNSGYPLDLNLYQGVKGMSAGARIVKPGGTLILAAECREGVPAGSPLDRLLRSVRGPEEILRLLATSGIRAAGTVAGADSGAGATAGAGAVVQLTAGRRGAGCAPGAVQRHQRNGAVPARRTTGGARVLPRCRRGHSAFPT